MGKRILKMNKLHFPFLFFKGQIGPISFLAHTVLQLIYDLPIVTCSSWPLCSCLAARLAFESNEAKKNWQMNVYLLTSRVFFWTSHILQFQKWLLNARLHINISQVCLGLLLAKKNFSVENIPLSLPNFFSCFLFETMKYYIS